MFSRKTLGVIPPITFFPAVLLLQLTPFDADAATVLAVVGDLGSPQMGATKVANLVASDSWQTDFVLALGDNSGSNYPLGSPEWDEVIGRRYGQFIKKRSGSSAQAYPRQISEVQQFFPVVGDHDRDTTSGSIAGYLDYFNFDPEGSVGRLPAGVHNDSQSYYDFTLPVDGGGTVHVFAMDSEAFAYSPQSQASQIEWLRDGLRNSTASWKFVTMHSPPYSSSLHNSNPLYQLPFQQWGAHAVFSGHDHVYERVIATNAGETGMAYFVNGLGGSNIYPFTADRAPGSEFRFNQDFGAMRVTVSIDQAVFEFFSINSFSGEEPVQGTLIDSFVLNKNALPITPTLGADFNDDGFVNEADLSTWRSAVGLNADGDANGDALSDGADFLLWQQQRSPFQPDHPPTVKVVPEPVCSVYLLGVAAMAAAGGRRQFSQSRC